MQRRKAKPKVRLMLDSGAFSAYVQNKSISLKSYIQYIKDHEKLLDTYFNLDVIPGKFNRRRSYDELEHGAKASRYNFLRMRKEGLHPIPVFHQEEDFKWLYRMVEDVADDDGPYIALSTLKELTLAENREWLDQCFTLLTDKDGKPKLKIHGLGVASFGLLKRYPWFSCDATSWALTAAHGSIFVPVYRNGVPAYDEAPIKLTVSEMGKKDGMLAPDHYLRMGPAMQKRVVHFLEKEVGVSVKNAAHDYEARAQAVVFFFVRFEEAINKLDIRFRHRKRGFFQ